MTDTDITKSIVWVTTNDFEKETGRIVIDASILEIFEESDLEHFKELLMLRIKELGKRINIRLYRGHDRNIEAEAITMEWRKMKLEERIRECLLENLPGGNITFTVEEMADALVPEIMKELNAGG